MAQNLQFDFGPFRLDEAGRVLSLANREVSLQPRIFELLLHLVRHRDRVVTKDELLDVIWPTVTVTENSLQRAVSTLRGALRQGGMESVVRSFSGRGYRFLLDAENPEQAIESNALVVFANETKRAEKAVNEKRWHDAAAIYAVQDADALTAHDLDQWALALRCLGKLPDALPVLVRTVAMHVREYSGDKAAKCAVDIASIHFDRGEIALAKVWVARAEFLVSESTDSPAVGHAFCLQSRIAASEGDMHGALELADATYNCGLRIGDAGLEALGLMFRGFHRLTLGDTRRGLEDQDRAAAFILSRDLDPVIEGTLYCNLLWACRSFGDWARANQWTLGYQQSCLNGGMEFSGPCQLHLAEVLGIQGSLSDALSHVHDALNRISDDAPWAAGDAYRVLGDTHFAIGNIDHARDAYEQAYALGWDPEPGYAMLQLELGQGETAYASLERALLGQSWWALQRRATLLAHKSIVAAHTGRTDEARTLINDLMNESERPPMSSVSALTNEAAAVLARNQAESNEALRHLQLARQLWSSLESRLHATRLRVQIADLQLGVGNLAGAAFEIRVALHASQQLGSSRLIDKCREVQLRLQRVCRPEGLILDAAE